MTKKKELIWLLSLWCNRGNMGDKELIEYFKILCDFPEYFNVPEPIQRQGTFIYTIEWKNKFNEDLIKCLENK
jgi:hypothetical protein